MQEFELPKRTRGRKPKWSADVKDQALTMAQDPSISIRQISVAVGVPEPTVGHWIATKRKQMADDAVPVLEFSEPTVSSTLELIRKLYDLACSDWRSSEGDGQTQSESIPGWQVRVVVNSGEYVEDPNGLVDEPPSYIWTGEMAGASVWLIPAGADPVAFSEWADDGYLSAFDEPIAEIIGRVVKTSVYECDIDEASSPIGAVWKA